MDDHNGHLILEDDKDGGAKVSLVFPPIDELLFDQKTKNHKKVSPMEVATRLVGKI
jgi:hypothetical protein